MFTLPFIFVGRVSALTIKVPPNIPIGEGRLWDRIIPGLIELFLSVALILALIYLLLGGFSWITAGNNKENLAKARAKITYAVLGLILALGSFAILFTFGALFGISLRNP